MKKLFTILAVVVLTTTISFAQKGTVAIGVGSQFHDISWQDYALIPVVGYFVTDKIMIGTGFHMHTSNHDSTNAVVVRSACLLDLWDR